MPDTEELLRRTLVGDVEAWGALQAVIYPQIAAIVRRHKTLRAKGLGTPDDVAEVATTTLERLSHDNFRNLRSMLEKRRTEGLEAPASFEAWLYGATDFVIREHLRKRYGRAPKQPTEEKTRPKPSKRDLQSQAGRIDDALEQSLVESLGMTNKLTIAEIRHYVATAFEPDEVRALHLYFGEGHGFAEIAATLELPSAEDAERLIRRLNARLRYHFGTSDKT